MAISASRMFIGYCGCLAAFFDAFIDPSLYLMADRFLVHPHFLLREEMPNLPVIGGVGKH
jgi:hypothetical protein